MHYSRYLFVLLIQVLFVNLSAQISKSDSIELAQYKIEEDQMWDSICTAQTQLAIKEIKLRRLTYVIPKGMVKMYESDEELGALLKQYKIKTIKQGIFCTAPPEKQYCYGNIMTQEIIRLYGSNFIDKKRDEAEKIYVRKNINKIFPEEECDRSHSIYPLAKNVDEYIDRYDRDYFNNFTYPNDFVHRKDDDLYSYTSVEFTLTKKGKIKNLTVSSSFEDSRNQKFTKILEEKAKKFVQNISWIPNKKSGIIVNSRESITFLYDKTDR